MTPRERIDLCACIAAIFLAAFSVWIALAAAGWVEEAWRWLHVA